MSAPQDTGAVKEVSAQPVLETQKTGQPSRLVRKFRQIVLLPLQLMPLAPDLAGSHRQLFEQLAADGRWAPVVDEYSAPEKFSERHYREFVSFQPHVQKFLYGNPQGPADKSSAAETTLQVFRRRDVRKVRMTLDEDRPPVIFDVAQIDLYFFHDIDIAILAFELSAENLELDVVQDVLFRFGRAYPAGWTETGRAARCLKAVEWLTEDGAVLAASDYEKRERYVSYVSRHKVPYIASHWDFLLRPFAPDHSDECGPLRYRQIEYYRMPLMAYLAMEDMDGLSRADYARLALITPPGDPHLLPFSANFLKDFEALYAYDRFYAAIAQPNWADFRVLTCGLAFTMVGSGHDRFFTDAERGVLAQFRHQYFLLFLIVHFHKSVLLMLSEGLVAAIKTMDMQNLESLRLFRRVTKNILETFLRFTHRYWFHEVSDQAQVRDLYRMLGRHLGTEELYRALREEIQDMSQYLDSESLRRQSNTMVRLTVVTILGLIGMTVTGFFGMNLIDEANTSHLWRIVFFFIILIPILGLTVLTIMYSKRLSDFLDMLSDERMGSRRKLSAFAGVFKSGKQPE